MKSSKFNLLVITDPSHPGFEQFKIRKLTDFFTYETLFSIEEAQKFKSPTNFDACFIMTMGKPLSFGDAAKILEIMIPKSPNLRWVHTQTTGIDFLLTPFLIKQKQISFTNAKGAYNRPLAEFALMCVLYFAKKMPFFMKIKQEHKFEKRPISLALNSKIAIIGYGSIGRTTATLMQSALKAKIYAITNSPVTEEERKTLEFVGDDSKIKDILPLVDYVITILPLTKQTKGIMNIEMFKLMKPSAVFINMGRGPICKESDLIFALKNNIIAGAGLDVFEVEPLPSDTKNFLFL